MSVVSELLREALIRHYSRVMLSAFVENSKKPKANQPKEAKGAKEESSAVEQDKNKVNYAHLACAYFDANHCSYLFADDIIKLFSNCGYTLSKKVCTLLLGNEEKIEYRNLPEPREFLPIVNRNEGKSSETLATGSIVERNGILYDINQLINQSEADEKLKVNLADEITLLKDKIGKTRATSLRRPRPSLISILYKFISRFLGKQQEYIAELEAKQKKMTSATEKQNDEICALKRERESLKTKVIQITFSSYFTFFVLPIAV